MNAHLFISYNRESKEVVDDIVNDLQDILQKNVWYDDHIPGGKAWWSHILEQIRNCEAFIMIVDAKSISSTACTVEREYARSLGKQIVPVICSPTVSINSMPQDISQLQLVGYSNEGKDGLKALSRALNNLAAPAPLPDPLPEEPDPPISELGQVGRRLLSDEPLKPEEQSWLIHQLRQGTSMDRADTLSMLHKMKNRPEVLASISHVIDKLITKNSQNLETSTTAQQPLESQESDSQQSEESGILSTILYAISASAIVIAGVAFIGYIIYMGFLPIDRRLESEYVEIRKILETTSDPGYPRGEFIAAHKILEEKRDAIYVGLSSIEKRSVDEVFAGFHVRLAEIANSRNMQGAFDANIEIARSLDADRDFPVFDSSSSNRATSSAYLEPYSFTISSLWVSENGDLFLLGSTDGFITVSFQGQQIPLVSNNPTENLGKKLRLSDESETLVDYRFGFEWTVMEEIDPLLELRLYDADDSGSSTPLNNTLLGYFPIRFSELDRLDVGESLTVTSQALEIGQENATITVARVDPQTE